MREAVLGGSVMFVLSMVILYIVDLLMHRTVSRG